MRRLEPDTILCKCGNLLEVPAGAPVVCVHCGSKWVRSPAPKSDVQIVPPDNRGK